MSERFSITIRAHGQSITKKLKTRAKDVADIEIMAEELHKELAEVDFEHLIREIYVKKFHNECENHAAVEELMRRYNFSSAVWDGSELTCYSGDIAFAKSEYRSSDKITKRWKAIEKELTDTAPKKWSRK